MTKKEHHNPMKNMSDAEIADEIRRINLANEHLFDRNGERIIQKVVKNFHAGCVLAIKTVMMADVRNQIDPELANDVVSEALQLKYAAANVEMLHAFITDPQRLRLFAAVREPLKFALVEGLQDCDRRNDRVKSLSRKVLNLYVPDWKERGRAEAIKRGYVK